MGKLRISIMRNLRYEINPIYLMQFNKNFKLIFMSKKLFLEVLNVQLIYILVETMYLG